MPGNKMDDYEVLSTIGTGSYGTCKKIRRKSDGKIRVWKELDYGSMTDAEKQLLVSEVNLLRELKHPNIVRYHDRIIDKVSTKIYIVMEYCEGGDLGALISKHRKERKFVEESFVWKVLHQLCLALRECHNCSKAGNSVLHRDLKPANVFLDGSRNVKLGDFGLARVLHHDTSFAKTFVGTPYYMSPELVNRSSYNQKSDIWSLGCLVYELCALVPPFLAANQKLLSMKIQDGHYRPVPFHYSKDLQQIIARMLTVVESERPSVDEILNSQHIQNYFSTSKNISKPQITPEPVSNIHQQEQQQQQKYDQQRKEEQLQLWEKKLDAREKELDRREKAVLERERLVTERLRDRPESNLYPLHKKAVIDKENIAMARHYDNNDLYAKHDRALRFLDQNRGLNRYETRSRVPHLGLR